LFRSPTGLFLQTIYHPLRLYAEHTREIGLDVHVSGETYAMSPAQETGSEGRVHHVAELGPFTLLDAAGSCEAAGRQGTLAVGNRAAGGAHRAPTSLAGAAAAGELAIAEVNGPDVRAMYPFDEPHVVDIAERTG